MKVTVFIRGNAQGLSELAEQFKANGIKCSRARKILRSNFSGSAEAGALGITGNSAAITVSLMTFLAKHRSTWKIMLGDKATTDGYTCNQVESALTSLSPVLERLSPEESKR